jgi:hypothetical protein
MDFVAEPQYYQQQHYQHYQHQQQQLYRRHAPDEEEKRSLEDDDIEEEDAMSFSSLRIVPFQDKPYHREWRTAVLRRKREQLARAVDGLSGPPSAQAAHFHREIISQTLAPAPETPRRQRATSSPSPVIPRVLPKSENTNGVVVVQQQQQQQQQAASKAPYPFTRKDAKKRKEATFTYVRQSSSPQERQAPPAPYQATTTTTSGTFASAGGASRTLASIAASLSYWQGQLNCADPPASASGNILTRCMGRDDREGRQDEERTPCSETSERKEAPTTTTGSQASGGGARRSRKARTQRSQVALEVIQLRKELKRLKHIVQEKKSKKETREREASPASSSSQATIAPFGATRVRFTDPMVTKVSYRPYTDPDAIDELFFDEKELNELEWDRQTVADDQYEVTLTGGRRIRIAHQKRRLMALHGAQQEPLPHSLSELSLY